MKKPFYALLFFTLLTSGCASSGSSAKEDTTSAKLEQKSSSKQPTSRDSDGVTSGASTPVEPQAAPIDPTRDLLGTVRIQSIDAIFDSLKPHLEKDLPAQMVQMILNKENRMQMAAAQMGMSPQEVPFDTSRPMALAAFASDSLPKRAEKMFVFAVPVLDNIASILSKMAQTVQTPQGTVYVIEKSASEKIGIVLSQGYVIASHSPEILKLGPTTLIPLVQDSTSKNAIEISLRVQKLLQLDKENLFEEALNEIKNEKEMQPYMEMINLWVSYIRSMNQIGSRIHVDGNALTLGFHATPLHGGAFSQYVSAFPTHQDDFAQYFPKHSLIYSSAIQSSQDMTDSMKSIDQAVSLLLKDAPPQIDRNKYLGFSKELQDIVIEAIPTTTGRSAAALWVDKKGGWNLGTIQNLQDTAAHKKLSLKSEAFFRKVGQAVYDDLKKMADGDLKGLDFTFKVKRNKLKVGKKLKADEWSLSIKWPKLKSKREKEDLKKVQAAFKKRFGKSLSGAWVYVDNQLLTAMGKDYKGALKNMVKVSQGKTIDSMKTEIDALSQGKLLNSLFTMALAPSIKEGITLYEEFESLPSRQKEKFLKVLPSANAAVPVSGLSYKENDAIHMDLVFSHELVRTIVRAVLMEQGMLQN